MGSEAREAIDTALIILSVVFTFTIPMAAIYYIVFGYDDVLSRYMNVVGVFVVLALLVTSVIYFFKKDK